MVKQFEEESENGFHKGRWLAYEKNKGLTRFAVKPLPCMVQAKLKQQ